MEKAIVVFSGGQDSTTCLFWALNKGYDIHTVTFNYGQRHSREIEAARKVYALADKQYPGHMLSGETINLGTVLAGKSFLTDQTVTVEAYGNFDLMQHHNAFKINKLDSSFVPMRNQLFLTLAANRAYCHGAADIITGVTAADFAEFGNFSWSWLGGFFDAEGCVSIVDKEKSYFRISLSQKDPELFHRLGNWLKQQFKDFTFGLSKDHGNCYDMTIGQRAYAAIRQYLEPHIHNPEKRTKLGYLIGGLESEAPLDDAYITGFWEGDGGVYSSFMKIGKSKQYTTALFTFSFWQKNPELLHLIQKYLGVGSLNCKQDEHGSDQWQLRISDGPVKAKLLSRMRPHFNVLGSFEKVTKYRHKINMIAGGFNPPYPDCSPDFIRSMARCTNEALRSPSLPTVKIITPLMFLTKAESVLLATSLPGCWEALKVSHTCYSGEFPPCGKCHACLLRAKGFEIAGIPDPLVS